MAEKSTIKGCPWCGAQPIIKAVPAHMQMNYATICNECGICVGWDETREAALARWNRRAESDAN